MHKNSECSVDKGFLCRMTVHKCASEAASSSAARQQLSRAPLQKAYDLEFELEVVMEDAENDDAARHRPGSSEPIREASTTTDEEDAELVYDHTHFWKDKVRRRYFCYYHGHRIIVKSGAIIEEFNEHAPRVWVVLDAKVGRILQRITSL